VFITGMKKRVDKKSNKCGNGRRAFFITGEDIVQALMDNYTAKDIWELLNSQVKMPIQYRTFMGYVNKDGEPKNCYPRSKLTGYYAIFFLRNRNAFEKGRSKLRGI
jgi:Family of unknown function (DUF5338)